MVEILTVVCVCDMLERNKQKGGDGDNRNRYTKTVP